MKKIILLAVFIIATGSLLHAQNTKPGNGNAGTNTSNSTYTDVNKNNVCDNYENNTRQNLRKGTARYAKGNGNGSQCGSQGCGRPNNTRGRS